jgi:Protein of unknown function (DUF1559)
MIAAHIVPTLAIGQEVRARPRLTLDVPRFDRQQDLWVTAIDPGGALRLEVRDDQPNILFTFPEGYYVLITGPETSPGPPRIVRVHLNEVVSPKHLELTVGPEAARRLAVGDRCALARPEWATTAQMRALPDIITVGLKPADSPAALLEQQRAGSKLNLQMIGLAMHNFQSTTNHFPPAVVNGPDGRPWHSWRVLLLPYLEQQELYQEYDFSQPWDGPNNIKLLDKMPDVYRDPVHGDAKGRFTHYAALVGAWKSQAGGPEIHTAFPPSGLTMKQAKAKDLTDVFGAGPGPGVSTVEDISDGLAETIGIVPVSPDRKIPWTKPEDITVTPNFPGLGKPRGIAAPYRTGPDLNGPRAAPVLKMDGTVAILLDTIDPVDLRGITTREGRTKGLFTNETDDITRIPILVEVRRAGPTKEPTLKIEVGGAQPRAWVER